MLHRFADNSGRRWRVETSGAQREVMGLMTVGVWFIDEATDWRVYGGLNPVEVERPTEERLRSALEEALRGQLDEGQPAVMQMQNDPEMFHINDERYVQVVRDPARESRSGYVASERLATFDEVGLRDELARLGFSADQVHAALALARISFVG